ncbi:RhoGAP-domain-containing protein [Daedalea quercina L-15889]|uniref:RhoGAP-domain-containing protein n=1 Tax=Daedalea quercina L-15889 TaxID=1314783 RepID=A0A165MUI5_9APHY|nr:RhoGAP-domain-containing protein [Daedalea quercina L-15889]
MSEGRYSPSSWDHADGSEAHHSVNHAYEPPLPPGPPVQSQESLDANGTVPPTPTKSTSPPRSSTESPTRLSAQRWRDSTLPPPAEAPDTVTLDSATLVEPSFDENVLRALCDLDCGIPLLLDRIKQSMVSCREASNFFKKRALLEEEYGRGMQRLAKATSDAYSASEGKAGTFVSAWHSTLKIHEQLAENRLRFAQRLNEMSQELATLAKEVDFSRKQTKELASRYEKSLQESEAATEKCKVRVDVTAEELERLLLQKEGESMKDSQLQGRTPGGASGKRVIGKAVAKGGMLLKGRNPGNLQRQEEDIRARMSKESDAYRKAVTETQAIRQEYFNFQYPRLLRALKECVDEIDLGTQYHLSRYAFLCESIVLSDGTTLTPAEENATLPGLKATLESIDSRSDFKTYMQNYAFAHGGANNKGPRRNGPQEEGFLPPIAALSPHAGSPSTSNTQIPSDRGRPTFGVDLAEQMARDDVDVPAIMVKCCEAIEKYGLRSQGIYRIGGTMSKVAKLKERLDRDLDSVNLDADEWSSDISNVTSVLKMWLRELPDPLLTSALHGAFLDAARNENERLRHIRLHERVNDLPDPNYSTLKYFMGHLHRVVEHEAENAMSVQNVAIVFGPTLFGQLAPNMNGQMNGMADAGLQNKAVETILEHYTDIFVDENES